MPDMNKPGAHLEVLLEHFECAQAEHFREAARHAILADTYRECAHRLKRAIEEEAEKAERAREAICLAELN